ncbi:MAG TPA: RNA polymerase sigma factor [Gammaproteobacteria bacterium]|jgi:RNA polymerase sigma-70 factor (ECF subfamily)
MDSAEATSLIHRYCNTADERAFNRFYREQAEKLWRFLVARGCDRELAYDLVAEAFSRFIQVVCRDPSSPKALLYRIAINLHIDHLRRKKPAQDIDTLAEPAGEGPDLEQLVHTRQILSTLGESEQNLLLMRYWVGMTYREIAEVLERPEGTIRRQSMELLRQLQARWGEEP